MSLFQLQVKFLDAVFDNEQKHIPLTRIGCFVQYDGQFVDVIMKKSGSNMIKPDVLNFTLKESTDASQSNPNVVLIVKDI
jgi:hypothetical protein